MEQENKKEVETGITPRKIYDLLCERVIGQEEAKKVISVAIYNHYKKILHGANDIAKSNILMLGPSGCGKTEIARTIARILDVPFVICDATTVTEAGYVGDDVENMLLRLIQAADYDIEAAEKGIIYIDEIDKIARKSESASITRDVSGEGVQQALLKIIEGALIDVPIAGGRKHPQGQRVQIDTTNILFICGGAFENLTMKQEKEKQSIGFGGSLAKGERKPEKPDARLLEKQGMIPELIGRLPIITVLHPLTEEDLKRILTEPVGNIISQYESLLRMDGVDLYFEDDALSYIAREAYEKGTGARGLKGVIEDQMNELMFEIPDRKDVKEVIVHAGPDGLSFEKKNERRHALPKALYQEIEHNVAEANKASEEKKTIA